MSLQKVFLLENQRYKRILVIFILAFCFCGIAYADPPKVNPGTFEGARDGFQHFYANLVPYIHNIVTDSSITGFSTTLWKFFSVVLIIWQMAMYVFGNLELADLFVTIFLIMVTRILMLNFDSMTAALWSWSEAFSTGIQTATIGVGDEFFAPRYIWNLMTSFSWPAANFLFHPLDVFAAIMLAIVSAILCVLGFFASVWALWGYSLAKMIGLMFVPTILFERLSWLFDGWLRFFFGFLIYNVIAKASLMLVIIALSAYFSLPADQIPQHMGFQFVFNSLTDVMGLLVFVTLSIIGLIFTGTFVRSIVSGSNTGSLLGGAKGLHSGLTTVAKTLLK